MKQSNAIAYLRQLCCSGLGKEIVIPEFLRAVQTVIPSGNNVFSGCDEHFNPSYHLLGFVLAELDEHAPEVILRYLTSERSSRYTAWFKQYPVLTDAAVFDESFYKSDLYNIVWRPNEQHRILQAPVVKDGKTVGILCLYRPRQQKPFDSREQAFLARLLPYVSHALQVNVNKNMQYSENGSSGMMILNTQGTILYLSHEAKNLLALACHPIISLDAGKQRIEQLEKLAQLCRNLETIFRGRHAAPPSWSYTGNNGRFTFRAYWLDRQNNEPGGLIGMTVEHQEPLVLKILRAMQNLPLSPTQKEVALLLAQGYASDKIGERLHIKPYTVKDHISKIFTKLDIHHREELLPLLLALDSSIIISRVIGYKGWS